MMLQAVLRDAATALAPQAGSAAKLEAQLLMQHVLDVDHAWLISHADTGINPLQLQTFQALLQRRLNGEPIAYILGYREFYGLKLKVTPDTLIPRADTETLVDAALAKIPAEQAQILLDLGTGSGAIALALAHHRPLTQVVALDASKPALSVAIENAKQLQIDNIALLHSHWFSAIDGQLFDGIVSNPPYIGAHDPHLRQGDLRFEPHTALIGGDDGLADLHEIIGRAPTHLKPQGWLMLEHGYLQAGAVATLLTQAGFHRIETLKDLGGNDRVTFGHLPH